MAENIVNLNPIFRGDSREYNLAFTDALDAVINISTWTIYFTVKKNYGDADAAALISKDITVHYDGANGKTKITLLPADTDIPPKNYFYDIQAKKAVDDITTVLAGRVEIRSDVTRRIT